MTIKYCYSKQQSQIFTGFIQHILFIILNQMGNTTDIKQFQWSLVSHPILRNSEIFQDKKIMKTTVQVLDQYDIELWIAGMQKIKAANCPYLLTAHSYSIKSRAMCGNSCSIKIKYENFPYILMDQILNRCKIHQQFEEDQVWYLLLVLTKASNASLSIQGKIGDVRPHNIVFNENGDIKTLHRFSYPGQTTNFQKTLFEKTRTFLSPQQFKLVQANKPFNNTNLQISQSFSVGMTMLCVLMLEDMSYLYDMNDLKFQIDQLHDKIQQLTELQYYNKQKQLDICYNPDLISLIKRLLEMEPNQRLNLNQLHKWLQPFEKQILNFQTFSFFITQKSTFSVSNYPNGRGRSSSKIKKNNSIASIRPSITGTAKQNNQLSNKQQIDRNPLKMNNKITRAFTINQEISPHFSSPQLMEKKKQRLHLIQQESRKEELHQQSDTKKQSFKEQSGPEIENIFNSEDIKNKKVRDQFAQLKPLSIEIGLKNAKDNNGLDTPLFPALKAIQMKEKREQPAKKNPNFHIAAQQGIQKTFSQNAKLKIQDLEGYEEPKPQSLNNRNIKFIYGQNLNSHREQCNRLRHTMNQNPRLPQVMSISDAAMSTNSEIPVLGLHGLVHSQKSNADSKPPSQSVIRQLTHEYKSSLNATPTNNYMQDDELLWKLDQQLNKSKQLFPK